MEMTDIAIRVENLRGYNLGAADNEKRNAAGSCYYARYRARPPRLQWGFLNRKMGVAVIYDMEADLIVTVFKPVEGALFFARQVDTVRIDRREWKV